MAPMLSTLKKNDRLIKRFYQPQPQIDLGISLRDFASACIDISDGLISDLEKLLNKQKFSYRLLLKNIPISNNLKKLINLKKYEKKSLMNSFVFEHF